MLNRLIFKKVLTPDFYKKLRTIKCNHTLEEYYNEVLEELFNELGYDYKRNHHICPDYEFTNGIKLEVKSTRTNRIKLNDSIPAPDVWYLILLTNKDRFIFCKGSELISDAERKQLQDLKDKLKSYRLSGQISSYPRANMSISLKPELMVDEDDFVS